MKTPNGKYSCKNGYLQIVIHRGRASACGEKFTVMTACNTFGKRPCGWGAQKPCVIRAEARIDFTSLTRSVFTCSKRLPFWTFIAVTGNYTYPEQTPLRR